MSTTLIVFFCLLLNTDTSNHNHIHDASNMLCDAIDGIDKIRKKHNNKFIVGLSLLSLCAIIVSVFSFVSEESFWKIPLIVLISMFTERLIVT